MVPPGGARGCLFFEFGPARRGSVPVFRLPAGPLSPSFGARRTEMMVSRDEKIEILI